MSVENLGQFLGYDVVGQFRPLVKFVRIPTENGSAPIEQAFFTMSPTEGAMAIPGGPQGAPGPKGDASLPWALQSDTYATAQDLGDSYQHLGDGDEGRAWFVGVGDTRSLYRWSGTSWEVYEGLIVRGPAGPPVQLSGGTVTILGAEAEPIFQVNGDPTNPSIHIGIPQPTGAQGKPGDTTINVSSYKTLPQAGQLLSGDPASGKLVPVQPKQVRGPYTLPPASFGGVSVSATDGTLRAQVASLLIPPQGAPFRLMINGNVQCSSGSTTRISVEVRLGDPATGTLLAYGEGSTGANYDPVHFFTCYETQVDPDNAVDKVGLIPANARDSAATVYVSVVKVQGVNQAWATRADRAQFTAWAVPA